MKSLIVIPTFNEKENIKEIVPEILKLKNRFKPPVVSEAVFNNLKRINILIADDNSPDGTGKEADILSKKYPKKVYVLHRKKKEGLGRAYIDSFKWALKRDYDLIFEMDADGSHSPRFIPDFLKKIKKYDVVLGSRYYGGKLGAVNWDYKRILLSFLANKYAKLVTGVPVSDATTGFKCFRRKVLEKIDLDSVMSEGYSFQIEMNWRAYKLGFRIGEIPIIFYGRRHGKSKLSTSIMREGLWILWKMRLKGK